MCKNIERTGEFTLDGVFKLNLQIPQYQRPYSWDKEQVEQLINDLLQAYKQDKIYLIGNMILYQSQNEENKCEIVDGQQRLTTLALLFKVLGKETNFLNNEISMLSAKKLKENYEILKNRFENFQNKENFLNFLKEKVIITYIQTNNLDEAFVLFDSQNTRGEELKRKDILKVHHIHPIQTDRKIYAIKWEKWEEEKITTNKDRLDELLYLISLTRKGITNRLKANDFVDIDVFNELKTKISNQDYTQLNNYNQPPIYSFFDFDFKNNTLTLITKFLQYKGSEIINGINYIPFEINSAIIGGEKFFIFVYKYYNTYLRLLKNSFFDFSVSGSGNLFIKKYYQAIFLFYYDKFENENLENFIKRLLLLLSYLRLKSSAVRKETILHQEWNRKTKLDIFALIRNSYSSYEIIEEIDNYIKFELVLEIIDVVGDDKYKNAKESYKKIFENFFGDLKNYVKGIKNGK
jgi:uncharacterized protein with ParB-like and HNH nuclease domain